MLGKFQPSSTAYSISCPVGALFTRTIHHPSAVDLCGGCQNVDGENHGQSRLIHVPRSQSTPPEVAKAHKLQKKHFSDRPNRPEDGIKRHERNATPPRWILCLFFSVREFNSTTFNSPSVTTTTTKTAMMMMMEIVCMNGRRSPQTETAHGNFAEIQLPISPNRLPFVTFLHSENQQFRRPRQIIHKSYRAHLSTRGTLCPENLQSNIRTIFRKSFFSSHFGDFD